MGHTLDLSLGNQATLKNVKYFNSLWDFGFVKRAQMFIFLLVLKTKLYGKNTLKRHYERVLGIDKFMRYKHCGESFIEGNYLNMEVNLFPMKECGNIAYTIFGFCCGYTSMSLSLSINM